MSDLVIFGIGLLVFFVTVFGVVMAGGLELARNRLRNDDELSEGVDERDVEDPLMREVEY